MFVKRKYLLPGFVSEKRFIFIFVERRYSASLTNPSIAIKDRNSKTTTVKRVRWGDWSIVDIVWWCDLKAEQSWNRTCVKKNEAAVLISEWKFDFHDVVSDTIDEIKSQRWALSRAPKKIVVKNFQVLLIRSTKLLSVHYHAFFFPLLPHPVLDENSGFTQLKSMAVYMRHCRASRLFTHEWTLRFSSVV